MVTLPVEDVNRTSEKAERDRKLFDEIADGYALKDHHPAARLARRLRLIQTMKCVQTTALPDILEVGCGAGFAAQYLCGRYRSFTGIDYSARLIEFASQRFSADNVSFAARDFYSFTPQERYGVVLMVGVLHHMVDIHRAVKRAHDLLEAGGWLTVNEPQPENPVVKGLRWMRSRIDSSYSQEQTQLRAGQLARLFKAAGFTSVCCRPQGLLSTPFAEVPLEPAWLSLPLARLACRFDSRAEDAFSPLLSHLTWNVVVAGRKR